MALGNDPDSIIALSIALSALQAIHAHAQETLDTILSGMLTNHTEISHRAREMVLAKMSSAARARHQEAAA